MKDLEVSLPAPCGEDWDAMSPRGCNRHCAACDTEIHDLSELTPEEAEDLIAAPGGACVRAEVGADGSVLLKNAASGRRMKAVLGGSLALAVAACQTTSVTPLYEVSGVIDRGRQIELLDGNGVVKTIRADNRGKFAFRNLRAGTYSLRTRNNCEDEPENLVEGIDLTVDDQNLGRVDALLEKCPVIIVGVMVPKLPKRYRG